MRILRTLAALALLAPAAYAAPLTLGHQGRLSDSGGAPLEGDHSVTVSIYASSAGGSALWTDTFSAVAFENGYYTLTLGSGAALSASAFDTDDLWVGISVDSGPELGRIALTSAPYAIQASKAMSVAGGTVDATSIAVNGTTVIDGSGAIAMSALPASLADGDADTLASITCSTGEGIAWNGSTWACQALGGGQIAAEDITSGTLDIARIPVGTTASTVAAGNHAHSAADITSGVLDAARLPAIPRPDGSSATQFAYSCESALRENPRAVSGEYWIRPTDSGNAWKAWCDMDLEGGGWIDVVKTFHITGADVNALAAYFFQKENDAQNQIIVSAASNVSSVKGILIRTVDNDHEAGFYLNPSKLRFTSARMSYRMQGSDEGYRCGHGNWIPLSGPGYNGDLASYLVACPTGYTCIQGQPTNGRDAPILVSDYAYNGMTNTTQLFAWSGSATGAQALNCARDAQIPTDTPAAFFFKLLLR